MQKKVSVIIPCYNQELYIKETIDSVLNQTYKNIEIICINDASTDKSAEIIKEYENLENFVFINNTENKGVIFSRNEAIKRATGEYILPLDGDDTIEPTYAEKAVKILDERPDIGIVFCCARLFGKNMRTSYFTPVDYDKDSMLFANSVCNSAFFRKSDFDSIGGYKDYMKLGWEDWDLWLSFLEKGYQIYLIPEFLFNYRKQVANCRTDSANCHVDELYTMLLKNHIELYANNKHCIEKIYKVPYRILPFCIEFAKYRSSLVKIIVFTKLFVVFVALIGLIYLYLQCAK